MASQVDAGANAGRVECQAAGKEEKGTQKDEDILARGQGTQPGASLHPSTGTASLPNPGCKQKEWRQEHGVDLRARRQAQGQGYGSDAEMARLLTGGRRGRLRAAGRRLRPWPGWLHRQRERK